MKKVWNVYECEDGVKMEAEPNSQGDINMQEHIGDYTFLGQVTEEIEEPKKEVEKVADVYVDGEFCDEDFKKVYTLIPCNTYDHKLHYKIKE